MPLDVTAIGASVPIPQSVKPAALTKPEGESFQDLLNNAVGTLGKLQAEADSSTAQLAAGGQVEIHEVLLATEKANLAFQLAVQLRNKAIEAYQEVMRMQV